MLKIVHAIAVGIAGAAIIHASLVLLLPGFGAEQAWSRLAASLPPNRLARANAAGGPPFPEQDPFLLTAVCRFSLKDGPLHVAAPGRVPAWFASVYAPDGRNLASLNDRMVPGNGLDFLVLTPEQMSSRIAAAGEGMIASATLEAEADAALLALRILVPDASFRAEVEEILGDTTCMPAQP